MVITPIIQLHTVFKSYGNNQVLDNFNLDVFPGEFLTVIGSSGCGKTTVLKLINGLLMPDSGVVRVADENIADTDLIALRRKIGYVIQGVGLFPHMNVLQNISYVPSLLKTDRKQMISTARQLMNTVGLSEELLLRYPAELSGGQRQRVGLARALSASPQILLMDEPFAAVDEITRKTLQDKISRIQRDLDITILFITHDIKEALKLGDRVLVMDKGKVEQLGTPDEIRQSPRTDFVAQLIGRP